MLHRPFFHFHFPHHSSELFHLVLFPLIIFVTFISSHKISFPLSSSLSVSTVCDGECVDPRNRQYHCIAICTPSSPLPTLPLLFTLTPYPLALHSLPSPRLPFPLPPHTLNSILLEPSPPLYPSLSSNPVHPIPSLSPPLPSPLIRLPHASYSHPGSSYGFFLSTLFPPLYSIPSSPLFRLLSIPSPPLYSFPSSLPLAPLFRSPSIPPPSLTPPSPPPPRGLAMDWQQAVYGL